MSVKSGVKWKIEGGIHSDDFDVTKTTNTHT